MIREADLASYLPAFMQKYKEPVMALEAENPEFAIMWSGVDRILYNRFISTADEYGIARFERLLEIYPAQEDDLESRRRKLQARWVNKLPYTIRVLAEKIGILSDKADVLIETDFQQGYKMTIHTMLELAGQVGELEHIIDKIVPCNIATAAINHIRGRAEGQIYAGSGMVYTDIIELEN